jgi:hypothetical protein
LRLSHALQLLPLLGRKARFSQDRFVEVSRTVIGVFLPCPPHATTPAPC